MQNRKKTIFIADRGYETYNIFAHIQEKGMYYPIRVKDRGSGSMTGGFEPLMMRNLTMQLILTRKQTNEVKTNPKQYKILPKASSFDYLDLQDRIFYTLNFRVVRFTIAEDSYECIITNLPKKDFPAECVRKVYAMRGELKHLSGN